jgi:hypothetical protein
LHFGFVIFDFRFVPLAVGHQPLASDEEAKSQRPSANSLKSQIKNPKSKIVY